MDLKQLFEEFHSASYETTKNISIKLNELAHPALSHAHLYLLLFVKNEQGCIVSDIAKHLGITLSGVTNLTNKLFDMGLIERKRSENDRRLVYIVITDKGKKLLNDMEKNGLGLFTEIFSNISKEEIQEFLKVLKRIETNSKKLAKGAEKKHA